MSRSLRSLLVFTLVLVPTAAVPASLLAADASDANALHSTTTSPTDPTAFWAGLVTLAGIGMSMSLRRRPLFH